MTAAKALMRKAVAARRSALGPAQRVALSVALAERAAAWLADHPGIISAFLPIGDELDTLPLLDRLTQADRIVCLPVMQGKDKPLIFRVFRPSDDLAVKRWGIREPVETAAVVEPQVLLVPLLAFDRQGHRLGYGGGYYDRTLRALRQDRPILAVGLAFDEQEVDAVPHLDYDERLDWILTPTRTLRSGR